MGINPHFIHPRSTLVNHVFGQKKPKSAVDMIHKNIENIRKKIGPEWIGTYTEGYGWGYSFGEPKPKEPGEK